MKKLLEVGDVVYVESWGGRLSKTTVKRVTATRAIVGNPYNELEREYTLYREYRDDDSWSAGSVREYGGDGRWRTGPKYYAHYIAQQVEIKRAKKIEELAESLRRRTLAELEQVENLLKGFENENQSVVEKEKECTNRVTVQSHKRKI